MELIDSVNSALLDLSTASNDVDVSECARPMFAASYFVAIVTKHSLSTILLVQILPKVGKTNLQHVSTQKYLRLFFKAWSAQ